MSLFQQLESVLKFDVDFWLEGDDKSEVLLILSTFMAHIAFRFIFKK